MKKCNCILHFAWLIFGNLLPINIDRAYWKPQSTSQNGRLSGEREIKLDVSCEPWRVFRLTPVYIISGINGGAQWFYLCIVYYFSFILQPGRSSSRESWRCHLSKGRNNTCFYFEVYKKQIYKHNPQTESCVVFCDSSPFPFQRRNFTSTTRMVQSAGPASTSLSQLFRHSE